MTQYRGLRYSFKRQIVYGQYCADNLKIRNDIAALILAGIVALPSWNLISSGIAEDIIDLLSTIESGTIKIWTKDVKFSDSDENFFFKRILLMIIAYLAEIDIYVFVSWSYQFRFINFINFYKLYHNKQGTENMIKKVYYILILSLSEINFESLV